MDINVWPRGAAVRGPGSVLGQTLAPAELRTRPTTRAGSPRSANLKAPGGLGPGWGAKDPASRELRQDGLLPSALVAWGKAEGQSDACQHPGQGRGQHQARAPSPSASGPVPQPPRAQGPPTPAPTSPGACLPWRPDPCTPGPTLPAQGRPGILRGPGTQTTGWSGSPSLGPGPGRLK